MSIDTSFVELINPAMMVLVSVTGLILLLTKDWRIGIGTLAIQYIGVFVLVSITWPVELAVVKLVAGWMAGAVLGMSLVSKADGWGMDEPYFSSSTLFRLLAASLVLPVISTIAPTVEQWLPDSRFEQVFGGMMLIGMGLLQLGFKDTPVRVVIGLLTILAGFEIYYATIEISALIAGLLAAVNLGLALVGAYLLLSPIMEKKV